MTHTVREHTPPRPYWMRHSQYHWLRKHDPALLNQLIDRYGMGHPSAPGFPAKYPGTCRLCSRPFRRGARIVWHDKPARTVAHAACAPQQRGNHEEPATPAARRGPRGAR
jgi:hypothetical protein